MNVDFMLTTADDKEGISGLKEATVPGSPNERFRPLYTFLGLKFQKSIEIIVCINGGI